jgi:uncharacterized protein (DUF427 family)
VRVQAGGMIVADSTRVQILFESDHIPIYYFPLSDIRMDLMEDHPYTYHSPFKGTARHYSLKGAGAKGEAILWHYDRPIPECPDISGLASFYWHEVEKWFEEDEEVFVHVRDPYRRVDCLRSARRVEVVVGGEVVADSRDAVFLFETGLPTRYYIPEHDIRTDLMSPSDLRTMCPYKGTAGYHHLTVGGVRHDNLVWHYADPVHEVAPIRGLFAFIHERVDRLMVDGVEQPRPETAVTKGYNYHGYRARP